MSSASVAVETSWPAPAMLAEAPEVPGKTESKGQFTWRMRALTHVLNRAYEGCGVYETAVKAHSCIQPILTAKYTCFVTSLPCLK